MDQREYQRVWHKAWRAKNKAKVNANDRRRWRLKRRYQRRAKKIGDAICLFCEIKLTSKSVGMKSKKYCDGCRKDPKIKRQLRNMYMKRWRDKQYKKHGKRN